MTTTLRSSIAKALLPPVIITTMAAGAFALAPHLVPTQAVQAAPVERDSRVLYADKLVRLTEQYHCGNLEPGTIPAHAILLRDGNVHLVSFDRGWAAYQGTAPGTLLMVCAS